MTYKTIKHASKKSKYGITFTNILNEKFFHIEKGYTDLKIKGSIEIDSLVSLIGGRSHNYKKLILDYIAFDYRSYSILERLVFNGNRWVYIAGQDYTAEMNTIRKIFRDGK